MSAVIDGTKHQNMEDAEDKRELSDPEILEYFTREI
jgi:hypothetical protein